MSLSVIIVLVVGYVIGSIPFAVIIARRSGVDILREGSGNPGATNVKRVVGKKAGNLCFVCDCLKGAVAAGWPQFFLVSPENVAYSCVVGLLGAILGHSFSMFIKFRGGKGVATAMGGVLAIMPIVLLIGVAVWGMVFFTTRYVSLGSILFGISLPLSGWLLQETAVNIGLGIILCVLIVVRHISNIKRLLNGTESRFEKR